MRWCAACRTVKPFSDFDVEGGVRMNTGKTVLRIVCTLVAFVLAAGAGAYISQEIVKIEVQARKYNNLKRTTDSSLDNFL